MEFGFKKKVNVQVVRPAFKTFKVEEEDGPEPKKKVKVNEPNLINVDINDIKFCKRCKAGFANEDHLLTHIQE